MQVSRLFDILPYQLAHYPKSDAIATKEGSSWRAYSTQELLDDKIPCVFLHLFGVDLHVCLCLYQFLLPLFARLLMTLSGPDQIFYHSKSTLTTPAQMLIYLWLPEFLF